MKTIRADEAEKFANSEVCFGTSYAFGDSDINLAVIEIKGRYPDTGYVLNEVCKELAYVISGTGVVGTPDTEVGLSEGDTVFLEPNEEYYFDGSMRILVPCTPAWYEDQHVFVEDGEGEGN